MLERYRKTLNRPRIDYFTGVLLFVIVSSISELWLTAVTVPQQANRFAFIIAFQLMFGMFTLLLKIATHNFEVLLPKKN